MSLVTDARRRAVTALGAVEGEAVAARLELHHLDLVEPLERVYGPRVDTTDFVTRLVGLVLDAACSRPERLRVLDRRREVDPAWFQGAGTVGYVCYADRFAGDIPGVRRRLDYLDELGVTYLHLIAAATGARR